MFSSTLFIRRFGLRKPGLPGWLSSLRVNFTLFVTLFCLLKAVCLARRVRQFRIEQS